MTINSAIADRALSLAGVLGARATRDRFRSVTADQLADAMISLASAPFTGVRTVNGEDIWAMLRG